MSSLKPEPGAPDANPVVPPKEVISPLESKVISKVLRYIIPISVLGLFVSFIDRTNISVAGPPMADDLGLTPTMFGLAAGLFFIGYVIFEIPSNLALKRFGAKVWIARIMVTWGAVCVATAWVTGAESLYIMRFLLGVAEAGFFPGILFYLGLFIPARHLTKAYSLFQIGIPFSLAFGAVLTSWILTMDGTLGFSGWQWVFIIEGGMAVVLGVACFFVMSDSPAKAKWLDADEKAILKTAMERDQILTHVQDVHGLTAVRMVLKNPQVWYYSMVYTLMMIGFYSVTYWLPQIIKLKFGTSNVESGLLSAIPWVLATLALIFVSRYTAKHGKRGPLLTIILFIAAAGMLVSSLAGDPVIALIGLCFGACIQACVPLLYSFPSQHFPGALGAVALALVNSIGNIGGFLGPFILGALRESFGTDTPGLLMLTSTFILAGIFSLGLKKQLRKSPAYVAGVE